jgi:hypothetical protein
LASLWQVKLAGREKSVPMTAERARRFGESLASQTGGKGKVSTNDGRKKMTMCKGMKNSHTKHLRAPPNKNDRDAEQSSQFFVIE